MFFLRLHLTRMNPGMFRFKKIMIYESRKKFKKRIHMFWLFHDRFYHRILESFKSEHMANRKKLEVFCRKY